MVSESYVSQYLIKLSPSSLGGFGADCTPNNDASCYSAGGFICISNVCQQTSQLGEPCTEAADCTGAVDCGTSGWHGRAAFSLLMLPALIQVATACAGCVQSI